MSTVFILCAGGLPRGFRSSSATRTEFPKKGEQSRGIPGAKERPEEDRAAPLPRLGIFGILGRLEGLTNCTKLGELEPLCIPILHSTGPCALGILKRPRVEKGRIAAPGFFCSTNPQPQQQQQKLRPRGSKIKHNAFYLSIAFISLKYFWLRCIK